VQDMRTRTLCVCTYLISMPTIHALCRPTRKQKMMCCCVDAMDGGKMPRLLHARPSSARSWTRYAMAKCCLVRYLTALPKSPCDRCAVHMRVRGTHVPTRRLKMTRGVETSQSQVRHLHSPTLPSSKPLDRPRRHPPTQHSSHRGRQRGHPSQLGEVHVQRGAQVPPARDARESDCT
jgi:hypothetical protein